MVDTSQAHWTVMPLPCCDSGVTSSRGTENYSKKLLFSLHSRSKLLNLQQTRLHSCKQCICALHCHLQPYYVPGTVSRCSLNTACNYRYNCIIHDVYFGSKFVVIVTIFAEWMARDSMVSSSIISSQFMPIHLLFPEKIAIFKNSQSYPINYFLTFIKLLPISLEIQAQSSSGLVRCGHRCQ